jgi:hypothetical protein
LGKSGIQRPRNANQNSKVGEKMPKSLLQKGQAYIEGGEIFHSGTFLAGLVLGVAAVLGVQVYSRSLSASAQTRASQAAVFARMRVNAQPRSIQIAKLVTEPPQTLFI